MQGQQGEANIFCSEDVHRIALRTGPYLEDSHLHKRVKQQQTERSFFIIDKSIYILTSSHEFSQLIVELTNIAEPITRPAHINQFAITKESLLRAKSLGYRQERVLGFLRRNMRNSELPKTLLTEIQTNLSDSQCCRLYLSEEKDQNVYIFQINRRDFEEELPPKAREDILCLLLREEPILEVEGRHETARFVVKDYKHNLLSEVLFRLSIPVLSEKIIQRSQFQQEMSRFVQIYKFKSSLHCKNLRIELKAFTKLRDYQSEALRAVVVAKNKQTTAKSGYIVLPCGAGKTLLGIAISAKIKKETLIVCSSDSGADQWKREIEKWTQGISKEQIIILTARSTEDYKFDIKDSKAHIYISTYSNLKSKLEGKEREGDKKEVKNEHEWMKLMPWGLIIFDEAQWLPAPGNSLIANSLLAHVKIGLTATPLRQDNNIKALVYMIGPQLYVGSWRNFVEMGYLANPKCLEVRTKMTRCFEDLYNSCPKSRQSKEKEALYQSNPNKLKALIYLLEYHERLNDNIIVFCDKISLIYFLAEKLQIPLLSGKTSNEDRNFVFDMFREGVYKTILMSRIGDEAIDLPNANVAIELNIHKGSRRQMLQRLGRIMRPKEASSSQSYNAVFYTIVSDGTLEMNYFRKRRDCLVDLGFQCDLRFFDYGADRTIADIYCDDQSEIKLTTKEKYESIITSETEYWNRIMSYSDEEDL